jgi:hypothetical protein
VRFGSLRHADAARPTGGSARGRPERRPSTRQERDTAPADRATSEAQGPARSTRLGGPLRRQISFSMPIHIARFQFEEQAKGEESSAPPFYSKSAPLGGRADRPNAVTRTERPTEYRERCGMRCPGPRKDPYGSGTKWGARGVMSIRTPGVRLDMRGPACLAWLER